MSLVLCLALAGAHAQSGFKFGVGINGALPVGNLSNISSFVIGGEVQGEYGFNDDLSGIFTTGYTHFMEKNSNGLKQGMIPLLAGARYHATDKFFVGGQLGYGFFTNGGSGGFAYKPQIGYRAGSFQITGSYNGISNNGSLGWAGIAGVFTFGGK